MTTTLTIEQATEVVTAAYRDGLSGERGGVERYRERLEAMAERRKALTMQDVLLACGELNKRERVAVQWVLDRCQPAKEEQQERKVLTDEEIERLRNDYFVINDDAIAPTNRASGFADGLRYARDNGYLSPAPFDVEGLMMIVDREVLTEQPLSDTLKRIRRALEAYAENKASNLRKP